MEDGFAVDLGPNPTALGFRHGASDTLASAVPAEIAVHVTGHDLENLSALWKYLNARVALLIPSVLVLSGWPKLPYGQLGDGPLHPSLDGIVQSGVSLHRLDMIIEDLFCFHDGSPPMLLRDGQLRALPAPHVCVRVRCPPAPLS